MVFSSCSIVRNTRGNEYVYKNKIHINGKLYHNTPSIQDLKSKLAVTKYEKSKNFLIFKYNINPSFLDSSDIQANLNSVLYQFVTNGYLAVRGNYSISTERRPDKGKIVTFHIIPGPIYLLTDVASLFGDAEKDALFLDFIEEDSYLDYGNIFSYSKLNDKLAILEKKMTAHGFAQFKKEFINVLIDTTYTPLKNIKPDLKKMPHRSFQFFFSLDTSQSQEKYSKYKLNDIFVRNMSSKEDRFAKINPHVFYQNGEQELHPNFIRRQIFLNSGEYYNSEEIANVSNRFWNARSFNLISTFNEYKTDNPNLYDSGINVYFELATRNKMSISLHSDLSFNDGARSLTNSVQNQLLDLSLATELNVNNLVKRSIQYIAYLRGGIQLNPSKSFSLSSQSFTFSNNFRIPSFWLFGFYVNRPQLESTSTNFMLDATYFNTNELFNLLNLRFSNQYKWVYKGYQFLFTPFNLEFYYFNRRPNFDRYLKGTIIDIQNSYRDGRLLSMIASVSKSWQLSSTLSLSTSLSLEETGLYGLVYREISPGDQIPLFFRQELNTVLYQSFGEKSTLVTRLYYGNNIFYAPNQQTPYFRKFFAGGAYSMRGWQFRSLGPGSISEQATDLSIEQLGDIKVEFNLEYRFNLFNFFSVNTEGAVFADIGNIWFKQGVDQMDSRGLFDISRLPDDLAISAGIGLRIKIDFLVLRLDWAYRLKDPQLGKGFMLNQSIGDGTLQIGIGYPF